MDIKEMRITKRTLEENITRLLREFEESTQVSVSGVYLQHHQDISQVTPQVISTRIEVEL